MKTNFKIIIEEIETKLNTAESDNCIYDDPEYLEFREELEDLKFKLNKFKKECFK